MEDKVTLLNEIILECLNETDENLIVKRFMEAGLNVLSADFGFVWLNSPMSRELELIYKSPNLPYEPRFPRKGGRNYTAMQNFTPNFVIETKKTADTFYVSKFLESFVVIPLFFKKAVYGTMVLCFKEKELFSKEKRILSVFIGNSVAQAITIHRLIEKEQNAFLLAAKQETDLKYEKLRTDFIANAMHEIRTPLAIIRGHVDLALMKGSNGMNALKDINHEVGHLTNMLMDLTLLTSTEGRFKDRISFRKVHLNKVIDGVADRIAVIANKKNIDIKFIKNPSVYIMGDVSYLEKLFANLIKNAVTYGREGGSIKIGIDKKNNSVEIKISDNGVGINKVDLPHIFERFYRANKSHTSETKNIGLGLAIAKWVVSAHGGTISVESKVGKGTIFTVSFPTLKLD
ncbi:MAG: GAF domain-containing sensor histidine kinase [bacterium]